MATRSSPPTSPSKPQRVNSSPITSGIVTGLLGPTPAPQPGQRPSTVPASSSSLSAPMQLPITLASARMNTLPSGYVTTLQGQIRPTGHGTRLTTMGAGFRSFVPRGSGQQGVYPAVPANLRGSVAQASPSRQQP